MSYLSSGASRPAFSPLDLQNASLVWKGFAILLGTGILAASSYISVPMIPVPITLQTLAVTMIGALYGWRLGAVTVIAWLAEAAVGMPVLAGGASGLLPFVGPTSGYLFSFPIIAALTGLLAERGWNGHRPLLAFLAMMFANLMCLAIGGVVLGFMIGAEKAFLFGVLPFLVGAALKSALGAALLRLIAGRGARPVA
ncbi:biotin transport system substrate-specific component [Neorhizobium huautlense]|uniref:Biotin transporter n=1 Tax=Neorhizobium huautlense TaxID=67774 RepID=A0ABT9PWH1_9HYPH|nr:biotin transporter BioY [Neorhizobium huautlense]MDP9838800.1 biotin transport system substrate-specific component [Neorhizobium huautlense]